MHFKPFGHTFPQKQSTGHNALLKMVKKYIHNNAFTVTYFKIRHFGPRTVICIKQYLLASFKTVLYIDKICLPLLLT